MLSYKIDGIDAFTANEGESSLMACLRQILAYEEQSVDVKAELAAGKTVMEVLNKYSGGEAVDLSGCTLEQLCYIVGQGTPVIAMTGSDSAILLVGYDQNTFTYIDPATGKKPTVKMKDVEKMTEESQEAFFGYVK